jgi:translation initiation factor 4E
MEDKEKAKTKLYKPFTLWYTEPGDTAQYEEKLKNVAVFDTLEDFWAIYQHIARPNVIPQNSDYNLFVDGIKPMWEDERNRNGGKWMLRMQERVS